MVSRDGVAYVPDEDGQDKDGFRLKYTQFLDELSAGGLRITSARGTEWKVDAFSAAAISSARASSPCG